MPHLISWLLTGGLIPFALLLCGGFFWFYLRGMPFLSPRGMLRALRHTSSDGVSPFRAVTLALAGTLGVGNIVGVAGALLMGGAGAIFWMWAWQGSCVHGNQGCGREELPHASAGPARPDLSH